MPQLVIALDTTDTQFIRTLAKQLDPEKTWLKVGLELFTSMGPSIVIELLEQNFQIFLDLKFHDIPNTVQQATYSATRLGVHMLTIHAAGGEAMMRAAVAGREKALADLGQSQNQPVSAITKPVILGVTVLTSQAPTGSENLVQTAVNLAQKALKAGLDGVVCSGHEAAAIKKACSRDFICLCPGIRPATSANDDQARTCTPTEAIQNGADFLVIGRPITQAIDPKAALDTIYTVIKDNSGSIQQ